MLAGRDDAHEVAVADDDHVGHRLRGGEVDRRQLGVIRGGRSTLPCHMPGSRMSEVYWCPPVTNERPSTFAAEWPATVHLSAGVVGASSDTVFVSLRPWVSLP